MKQLVTLMIATCITTLPDAPKFVQNGTDVLLTTEINTGVWLGRKTTPINTRASMYIVRNSTLRLRKEFEHTIPLLNCAVKAAGNRKDISSPVSSANATTLFSHRFL
jgi:hypothetical protein